MIEKKSWQENCYQKLLASPNKKIVLIGGASSAGKTYKCRMLKDYIEKQNKKCFVVSMDNFYKCISERIVENCIKNYKNLAKNEQNIAKIVKSVTKDFEYDKKFCEQNLKILKHKLKNFDNENVIDNFILDMQEYHKNINFDVPNAIDFKNLTDQINNVNKIIKLPTYSFKTSEIVDEKILDTSKFDYIIFEGIFALSNDVLNHVDEDKIFKISLKSDLVTMLSRRFHRDIQDAKRTRNAKETFESYFKQVMPCYFKYIQPTLKNADICINSTITFDEMMERKQTDKIEIKSGYKIFDEQNKCASIILQTENNKPKNLMLEYVNDNKYYYDTYDCENQIMQNDVNKVLKYFKDNNFKIEKILEKKDGILETL